MNLREAESYLYSLGNEVSAMKLGLDAMRILLRELGDPQTKYLKVQVAGTNGKGSVCAFLDSICNTAGIQTGTFTSPHLISITERVRINGVDISEDEFTRHVSVVREASERLAARRDVDAVPTFFEQVTAIALVAFADAGVELAILETGLGGRLDATTAADAEIAAITRIDLDHQRYLGETIEEIAAEKAAIIHENSQVVVGAQSPEAMEVVLKRCRKFDIIPHSGRDATVRERALSDVSEARSLTLAFLPGELGLKGKHQAENAAVAAALADVLKEYFAISDEDVIAGLAKARHPGRLEYQGRYLFDGAHNIGGAKALAEFIRESDTRPITLIFGAMNDKNVREIAEVIFPLAEHIVLTRADNSRAMSADELAALIKRDVTKTEGAAQAIRVAEDITPDDGIILVTGSLYLVGQVKKLLNQI